MADRKPVNALPTYVTLSEVHRILAECVNERDKILVELCWRTGGRVSEILALRVGDITAHGLRMPNLKQGRWTKDTEGNPKHVAVARDKQPFVGPEFLERLRAYAIGLPPEAALIGRLNDGKPITRQHAWRIVTGAAAKAGVFKRRFRDGELRAAWVHTFRHGHATHLLEAGMPVTLIQAQLGHSSLSSTQVYTQLVDPRRQELIDSVDF